jgi:hypothetical protein
VGGSEVVQARSECVPHVGFTKNSRRMCYVFGAQINSGLAHVRRTKS